MVLASPRSLPIEERRVSDTPGGPSTGFRNLSSNQQILMPTLLSDLINAIPVAGREDVISPESHNSVRDAIVAIVTELGGAVASRNVTLTFAPTFLEIPDPSTPGSILLTGSSTLDSLKSFSEFSTGQGVATPAVARQVADSTTARRLWRNRAGLSNEMSNYRGSPSEGFTDHGNPRRCECGTSRVERPNGEKCAVLWAYRGRYRKQ